MPSSLSVVEPMPVASATTLPPPGTTRRIDNAPTTTETGSTPMSYLTPSSPSTIRPIDTTERRVPGDSGHPKRNSKLYFHPSSCKISNQLRVSSTTTSRRRSSFIPVTQLFATVQTFSGGFLDVFGLLGIPMIVAFGLSAVAMAFTAIVQLYPDEIGNLALGTRSLDNGDFLMLAPPSPWIMVTATVALLVFCLGYVALIIFMLSFRSRRVLELVSRPPRTASLTHRLLAQSIAKTRFWKWIPRVSTAVVPSEGSTPSPNYKRSLSVLRRLSTARQRVVSQFIFEFTDREGLYHEYHVAAFDVPKLVFQTANLVLYMTEGFPLALVTFYALPLMINWVFSFYRFQRSTPDPMLVVSRAFYLFDLFFAVFAPIVVLAYAYYNFNMDRATFASRVQTLTPGMFDRIAKLFADPVQIEVFRQGFSGLQLTKPYYIAMKAFLNLLGIHKWKKVIVHLIAEHQQRRQSSSTMVSWRPSSPRRRQHHHHRQSRRHLLLGAVVFLCCSVAIAVYTTVAVVTSFQHCAHYSKCVVFAFEWHTRSDSTCACIVFIDRDTMPTTFEQWINPVDVTDQVRVLAASGNLQTVQLINRAMVEVPDELRGCKNLKTLILLYSKTQRLPDWAKEWTSLRYLHLEGDFIHYPLQYLPSDLFSNMHSLRFLRIAGAAQLRTFPSLAGLHQLSTLVITNVRLLRELPSLDDLTGLRTLIIAELPHIPVLPSLRNLKRLTTFTLFRRNEVCCNGYATGYCDLTNFQCLKRVDEPEVKCVDARMPAEDLAVVKRANGFLCGRNITQDMVQSEPTPHSSDGICGGVMYRECYLGGIRGICYNGRMEVVHCDVFGEYEKMRRLQIAWGVGDACDPGVEAWLGC